MNSGAADPGSGLCLENKVGRGTIGDLDIILARYGHPTLRVGRDRDRKAGQAPAISRHLLKHRGGRRDSKHGIAGGRNGQLIFSARASSFAACRSTIQPTSPDGICR